MSFVLPGRSADFRALLHEILDLRVYLLSRFEYRRLLDLSEEDAKEFITDVRKNLGSHWNKLNTYLQNSTETRDALTSTDLKGIQLPSIRLDVLIRLAAIEDDQKAELKTQISDLSNRLLETLNLEQLINHLQRDYFGQVEISAYHVYSAIYATVLRLTVSSEKKTLAYLKTWLRAQGNWESLQQLEARKFSGFKNFAIISLNASSALDREYGELYGQNDAGLEALEIAEREFSIADQLFRSLSKYYSSAKDSQELLQKLCSNYQGIRLAYQNKNYNDVHNHYDEFLEVVEVSVSSLPDRIRRSILPSDIIYSR